jgi:hypothetical protein
MSEGIGIMLAMVLGTGFLLLIIWLINVIKTKRNEEEPKTSFSDETVNIWPLTNSIEAEALSDMLKENGIECLIDSFEDRAYDGIFTHQKGWGKLKVSEKDASRAKELITEFLKTLKEENANTN